MVVRDGVAEGVVLGDGVGETVIVVTFRDTVGECGSGVARNDGVGEGVLRVVTNDGFGEDVVVKEVVEGSLFG